MIIKILVFTFICSISWTGDFVDAKPPSICPGVPHYNIVSPHDAIVQELQRRGFNLENSELDKLKILQIFSFNAANEERGLKIVHGYLQCVDEVISREIQENKYEAYLDCLNKNDNARLLFAH
ncbi:uncharacterized protein [Fopius arisanus]|uniref:Uncharacterized protein n=1 Tax=Fopius arisanus TaxID=64838 RepID=A0A9R1SWD1_9HYME|nr:PREDICTED: uncharacterized protein LOC105263679 [Fopius arisanus]